MSRLQVNHLESVVRKFVQSSDQSLRHTGCQIVLAALGHSTNASVDVLNRYVTYVTLNTCIFSLGQPLSAKIVKQLWLLFEILFLKLAMSISATSF